MYNLFEGVCLTHVILTPGAWKGGPEPQSVDRISVQSSAGSQDKDAEFRGFPEVLDSYRKVGNLRI